MSLPINRWRSIWETMLMRKCMFSVSSICHVTCSATPGPCQCSITFQCKKGWNISHAKWAEAKQTTEIDSHGNECVELWSIHKSWADQPPRSLIPQTAQKWKQNTHHNRLVRRDSASQCHPMCVCRSPTAIAYNNLLRILWQSMRASKKMFTSTCVCI